MAVHEENVMRKVIVIFCGLLLAMSLMACGTDSLSESALKIDKNGQVTSILVEEFDKNYYDINELEEMIRLEIAEYNRNAGSERILLVSLEHIDKDVKAVLQYTDYTDYASFNEVEFFVGTVEEAVNQGINLNHVMLEAGKDNTISPQQVKELTDYNLIMWQGDMPVEVPGKIKYHTGELTLLGSKKIISEPDLAGPFYLIYK